MTIVGIDLPRRGRGKAIIELLADERKGEEAMVGILWAVVAILVVLWLIGFVVLHVSSALIHLLLIIAVIVLLYNLFVGGRSRRTL